MSNVRRRLDTDLAAIGAAIEAGQLEDAKRMLLGVSLNVFPGGKSSQQIGDLYLELGFPAMAGRYWYLLDEKSDRMVMACEEFERSLGDNPRLISEAMGWSPGLSPHAKAKLAELHARTRDLCREYRYDIKPQKGWRDRVALLGCAVVGFIVMFVFVMGTIFIAHMFSPDSHGHR